MQIALPTLAGLEDVLAEEFTALGATDVSTGRRVVTGFGDRRLLYRANLELRTALRVLLHHSRFPAPHEQALYDRLRAVAWEEHLRPEGSLFVQVVNASPAFRNSHYLAQLTKDAIVDRFRDRTAGKRPSVDKRDPDLRIHLRIDRSGRADLSLDSSGDGLHRRGYRRGTGPAPLNEVLAAGLLALAGYSGERPFADPMCGSGTILAEAATRAAHQAPGLFRDFGFQRWPDFEADLWAELRAAARSRRRTPPYPILGADVDPAAVRTARGALDRVKLLAHAELRQSAFSDLTAPAPGPDGALLVTNPPYEMRLETGDIEALYAMIGDTLKQGWVGYTAWLISANAAALKRIGLRSNQRIPLMNGPVEVRLCEYSLYSGREKKNPL